MRIKFVEIGQRVRRCGANLYQKVEIFDFGAAYPLPCTDWREMLHGRADPRAVPLGESVNESPMSLWDENSDFRPLSKTIPTVCSFAAILPVNDPDIYIF